jgi:hypothetical protein
VAKDNDTDRTRPLVPFVLGNELFTHATEAMKLEPGSARRLLADVLRARQLDPSTVTAAELFDSMPDVEAHLRVKLTTATTEDVLARLRIYLASLAG